MRERERDQTEESKNGEWNKKNKGKKMTVLLCHENEWHRATTLLHVPPSEARRGWALWASGIYRNDKCWKWAKRMNVGARKRDGNNI